MMVPHLVILWCPHLRHAARKLDFTVLWVNLLDLNLLSVLVRAVGSWTLLVVVTRLGAVPHTLTPSGRLGLTRLWTLCSLVVKIRLTLRRQPIEVLVACILR